MREGKYWNGVLRTLRSFLGEEKSNVCQRTEWFDLKDFDHP
jgi:hypothetical protein